MPKNHRLLAALLLSITLLSSHAALAQSVDYSAFEQLFGEPVTSSVTGKPQRATDAPANIEIITQDDVRRSGATSIPDVLQFVSGIDVRWHGLASADVGIRGYNSVANPYLMVLVNGRQIYMVDYGHIVWPNLPVQLDEIKQIEVIKGPNSALYGFNAVSGVINIITYDPLETRINRATLRAGTQSYASGSAIASAQVEEKFGMRVSLGGFRAHDYAPGPLSPFDKASRQSPFEGAFNITADAKPVPSVRVYTDLSMANTRAADLDPAGNFDTDSLRSNAAQIGVSVDTSFGLLSLSAYRNETLLSLDTAGLVAPVNFAERQVTNVVQASDLLKLGTDHTVRLALEYRDDSDQSQTLSRGTISNGVFAASLMWDWQITPRLSLTNAVRVDHQQLHYNGSLFPGAGLTIGQYNSATVTKPSFNSGLVWKVTDADTLRFMLAQGVQLPSLLYYGLQTTVRYFVPVDFSGRPDLNPAIMRNAEVDYDRALPAIGSTQRTAVFAQRLDDIVSSPFGTPMQFTQMGTPIFYSANVGYSTAAGLEIGIKGQSLSGFRWNLSYSFSSTTDHTSLQAGPNPRSVVHYANAVPQHVGIGGIGYSKDRWELDLMGRWQSSYVDFRTPDDTITFTPVIVRNYLTATARIGYRLTENIDLALTAQQFLRSSLVQTAGPPVERRVIGWVSAHF